MEIKIEGKTYSVGDANIQYIGTQPYTGEHICGYFADIRDENNEKRGDLIWKNVDWECEDESEACDWDSPDEVWMNDVEITNYEVI